MLSKLNQQSEEKRLKSLYEAKLVLSFDNILEWNGGNERDREIKVYNYSRASTVDKTLIRSDDELEEIAEKLGEGFPWEILNEDPYEPKESYIIFGDIYSISICLPWDKFKESIGMVGDRGLHVEGKV